MEWEGKNVLITGATGFVGSWLTKALTEKRSNVFVIALSKKNLESSVLNYMEIKPKDVVFGSITNFNLIKDAFEKFEIEACFHLAAQAIVTVANRSPIQTFETNISGTWNVLEAARTTDLKNLIVASTDKVYGEPIELPITEDHPLLASYPYDASKACADILSRTYSKTYGLPVAVTRCCNIFGGGDLNFTRIIPESARSVIFGKNPVIRSDGTPIRDFIFISDAVDAYLTLADDLKRNGVMGEAFNFGSNSPISILDLVKKIIQISGKDLQPDIQGKGKPHAEISRQYLGSEKAKKLLNWEPKVKLKEGLEKTIEWYTDFFKKRS